jgi:hypothetical protein
LKPELSVKELSGIKEDEYGFPAESNYLVQ